MSQLPVMTQPNMGYAMQPGYAQPDGRAAAYAMAPQPGYGGPPQQQVMMRPQAVPGCPPGLEYLMQVDQLLVHQQVELLEVFVGLETNNKYVVKNSMGQQVFYAAEDTGTCMRICCGNRRGFTFRILDNGGQEVMHFIREFKFCAGVPCCACSDCCAFEVRVEAPIGMPIGYIRQAYGCVTPYYDVLDANREPMLRIKGPRCILQGPCCTGDKVFKVYSTDMTHKVGKISKQWGGLVRELTSDATNFGVNFPIDLDVKAKATLLGAVLLIDMMFFEKDDK